MAPVMYGPSGLITAKAADTAAGSKGAAAAGTGRTVSSSASSTGSTRWTFGRKI